MIDEAHVRELRDATNDGAALVLLEGRARVVDSPSGEEGGPEGALVVISKRELSDRLGAAPTGRELRELAQTLTDTVGKLGA
ncbi:hypothetical protein ABTY20_25175 [Streptomyces sp. NPDC126497]|uniref:hypothetical protein n=1 Tax=Streptomyces sp. NPDC126497 TaxID=3155313 RepID=UPI003327F42C